MGLAGNYDCVLRYKGRWDRDRNADDLDPTPPIDRLQQELGLKVEAARGPVTLLVIDHIEKPTDTSLATTSTGRAMGRMPSMFAAFKHAIQRNTY